MSRDPGDDWRGYIERLPRLDDAALAEELEQIDWEPAGDDAVALYGSTILPSAVTEEAARRLRGGKRGG